MREKLKKFCESPRSIIAGYSAAVLFFCTVFTRLILKTDDGHFLGILHRSGFTVPGWLHERYTTVSGRIVGEWLMINFLRLPLIFWKLFIAALIIYIMWFICRISDFFGEKRMQGGDMSSPAPCLWQYFCHASTRLYSGLRGRLLFSSRLQPCLSR